MQAGTYLLSQSSHGVQLSPDAPVGETRAATLFGGHRIPSELHKRVDEQAAKAGESINQFIAERLAEVA